MAQKPTESGGSHPKITIGLTCFNAKDTIALAIQSALDQDWPSVEVLIVDDFSTDGSKEIIQTFLAESAHIRLYCNSLNEGAAACRNTILHLAAGEFVAFFDDDDVSSPARIGVQVRTLLDYEKRCAPAAAVCYASARRLYPNGYEMDMPAIGSAPCVPHGEDVANYLLYNSRNAHSFYGAGTPTCSLMARVSTLRSVGGFDVSLRRVEDVDLAVRLALSGCHFVGTQEWLVLQYATISADKSALKNFQSETMLIEKHSAYLRKRRAYDYAKHWFYIRYLHFDHKRLSFVIHLTLFFLRYPLRSFRHVVTSLPKRWLHERRMRSTGNLNK